MLDARTENLLTMYVETVRGLLAPDLVSVVLYGSGAGDEYDPGTSDLNTLIVVDRLRAAHLRALSSEVRRWRARRFSTPLVFDRDYVARARDVFPIEFHELRDRHRVLAGEDWLATLELDDRNLRAQCEHEARAKLLRLRERYLESAGRSRELRALMLESMNTFRVIVRACLRLDGIAPPLETGRAVADLESHRGASFPVMRRLAAIRRGEESWDDVTADEAFADYLDEVAGLVGLVDRPTRSE
ncbi:MAG: hypothetical protein QOD06_158 [Candidatus Binatota bacterium]|jgi:hypothetical protein|nr:hypothetical protein [Candidatus Binatota bacterium]